MNFVNMYIFHIYAPIHFIVKMTEGRVNNERGKIIKGNGNFFYVYKLQTE